MLPTGNRPSPLFVVFQLVAATSYASALVPLRAGTGNATILRDQSAATIHTAPGSRASDARSIPESVAGAPGCLTNPPPEPAGAGQAAPDDAAELSREAAARMNALRKLMVSLAQKNRQRLPEEAPTPLPAKLAGETAVRAPEASTAGRIPHLGFAAPRAVGSRPDAGSSENRADRASSRNDRRVPSDDVAILPSWPGQYEKKK